MMETAVKQFCRILTNSAILRTKCSPIRPKREFSTIAEYESNSKNEETQKETSKHGLKIKNYGNKLADGPSLHYFITKSTTNFEVDQSVGPSENEDIVPYFSPEILSGKGRKVCIETHGCQMNFSDTEVAWSILKEKGFERTDCLPEADVLLVVTCAIREGAEQKIRKRLAYYSGLKKRRQKLNPKVPVKIGILGCMAERLKTKLLEQEDVDIICGPDSYRDLPRMLASSQAGHSAVNVQLSMEETYADIMPVRLNENSKSAFVSIMRGCDNMCSYCIVPFTRGRERSRPIESIINEIKTLSDQGVKEVMLLGQNVNSYRDLSESQHFGGIGGDRPTVMSEGFETVYRPKHGGKRFSDLLDRASLVDPDMRIRFTSPHPKDFPDEVLYLIQDRPNICKQIHLPAQSGNSDVLAAMRRGYTREAYIQLLHHIQEVLPGVSLTSDFIAGFCGETEEAHEDTLSLLRLAKYDFVWAFPYSMRQKTKAFHWLQDDVPQIVKQRRMEEILDTARKEMGMKRKSEIGKLQLVLIDGDSKKSSADLVGRNDGGIKVVFPQCSLPGNSDQDAASSSPLKPGDYVIVKVTSAEGQTMRGVPVARNSLREFTTAE
ncbi:CDK5 regulatory subunit-associated protein 1 [Lingula anatina]|uniref:CDK5 regulatory subunit-associated protein 1 n=1 Tax=Lingula anatina TaxID=7574 RepID=A0A1S3JD81_LINAN|nr:CDK5 regulatory subunit-associated protein 1 [Lingula anatina]|eukprot:XP_013408131.1 CDK5 regulatory subunit-associated protein 1 [Lingula anatina]